MGFFLDTASTLDSGSVPLVVFSEFRRDEIAGPGAEGSWGGGGG